MLKFMKNVCPEIDIDIPPMRILKPKQTWLKLHFLKFFVGATSN